MIFQPFQLKFQLSKMIELKIYRFIFHNTDLHNSLQSNHWILYRQINLYKLQFLWFIFHCMKIGDSWRHSLKPSLREWFESKVRSWKEKKTHNKIHFMKEYLWTILYFLRFFNYFSLIKVNKEKKSKSICSEKNIIYLNQNI